MNRYRLARFGLLLSSIIMAASWAASGKVTLQELCMQTSIRIADLKRLDLDVKQGHGPLFWAVIDDKTEVQFWYQPGPASAMTLGKIKLITTGAPNDENHGTIIWPKEKVGHDFGSELHELYGRK
jgi:hypothetical protein